MVSTGISGAAATLAGAHPAVAAAASTGSEFLGVDWGSIALVFVVGLIATVVVVSAYSFGIRLLAIGSADDTESTTGGRSEIAAAGKRPAIATAGGYVCIAIGIVGVLYGIYLVIPQFH